MYQVNLGDKILYYPASEDACIYDTELNEDVGQAGEFKFKVPSNNPLYSELAQGSLITIYRDKVEYWRGEIKEISYDFAKVADVYCIEDLTWLNEEYLAPASVTTDTYSQRLLTAISAYNANRPADRQFTAGYITNVTNTDFCNWTTEYEQSILDQLRNCICNASSPQGLIRVRRVTSGGTVTRYIDIVRLADYGIQATQPIEYGYNLLDYVKESDFNNLVNVLTPYGDETDTPIYDEYNARLQGTTITDATSIGIYGRHAKDVVFDGVSSLASLNSLAQSYLTRYSQPQLTMEVQAVDLAGIENVDAISIGDSVRIIAQPFAVDQWLYLTEISRDIQNIDKNKITLSGNVQTGRTLTSQTQGTQEAIKKIPSKSSILEAAKKNALEILNGTEGGYVTFETNADDQITELRIANNLDINQATKCWKWNLGGLGYMSRDTASDPWAVVTAATMDGEIVADFITTGTMLADRILGGTLKLGGYNNENGIAEVYDSDNVAIVRLDGQGVYLNPKGRIGSEEGFAQIFIERGGFSCKGPVPCYVNGEINPNPTTFGGLTYGTRTVHNVSGWNDSPSILCLYAANDLKNAIVVAQAVPGGNAQVSHVAVRWNIIQIVGSGGGVIAQFGESEYDYWNGLSDRNKKKNIKDVPVKESKNIIKQLRPRSFNFRKSSSLDSDKKHIGFIAQEVQEIEGINDGIVLEQASGDLSLGYREIIPHLVNVVNEQQKEIDALKEELKKIKEGR